MHITLPDPDPGRCKNLRPASNPTWPMRRCLEYDAELHVCDFEPDVPGWERAGVVFYSGLGEPKPWVKPS